MEGAARKRPQKIDPKIAISIPQSELLGADALKKSPPMIRARGIGITLPPRAHKNLMALGHQLAEKQ